MADGQIEPISDADEWVIPLDQPSAESADGGVAVPHLASPAEALPSGAAELFAARGRLETRETYTALAELFGALADPTRARIVHLLMQREWTTSQIAAITGASEPATSQHLRVLRGLHLVRSRRAGRWVYYRLDDLHVALLMRTSLSHLGDERAHVRAAHETEVKDSVEPEKTVTTVDDE